VKKEEKELTLSDLAKEDDQKFKARSIPELEKKLEKQTVDSFAQYSPLQIQAALNKAMKEFNPEEMDSLREKIHEHVAKDNSILSLEASVVETANSDNPIDGLLVFYINVGQLPFDKAEALIETSKERVKPVTDRVPDNYGILWFPVTTPTETGVELIEFVTTECEEDEDEDEH